MKEILYHRRCKNIERLAMYHKNRSYNLLEHGYMVAVLFMKFAKEEKIDFDVNVLDLVLKHDLLESQTQDLSYEVKNFSEVTKECWNKIENEVIIEHELLVPYSDDNLKLNLTPQQHNLFKCVDLLDLWIFLKEEVSIGNRSIGIIEIIERCEKILENRFKSIDYFIYEYNKAN